MYPTLRENLENGRLFMYIERSLDLHLDSSDKLILIRHLRQANHPNFDSLWQHVRDYLWNNGFRSRTFEEKKRQSDLVKERTSINIRESELDHI